MAHSIGVEEIEAHRDDKGQNSEKPYCDICKAEHELDECKRFNGLDNKVKFDYIQYSFLWRGCSYH